MFPSSCLSVSHSWRGISGSRAQKALFAYLCAAHSLWRKPSPLHFPAPSACPQAISGQGGLRLQGWSGYLHRAACCNWPLGLASLWPGQEGAHLPCCLLSVGLFLDQPPDRWCWAWLEGLPFHLGEAWPYLCHLFWLGWSWEVPGLGHLLLVGGMEDTGVLLLQS